MTPTFKAGATIDSRGFTLIELMMVILVIGVVYFIVVPRIAPTILNLQLGSSAKRIANELRYLHTSSILRKESFAFYINMDTGEYWVERVQAESEEMGSTKKSIEESFDSHFSSGVGSHFSSSFGSHSSSGLSADSENRNVPVMKIPNPLAHSPSSFSSSASSVRRVSSSLTDSVAPDEDLNEAGSTSGPALDEGLLLRHKLENGVKFQGIELVESGQVLDGEVEVDLSPRGFVESGLIRLIDDDENEMTIFINNVTGEIKLYDGHLELEDFGL